LLGYFAISILGIIYSLDLTWQTRLIGLPVIFSGVLFLGWPFKYKRPIDILISTYVTFLKIVKSTSLETIFGRTEPLVIQGPHKHVRHPPYFGVVTIVFGLGLLLDYSILLISAIALLSGFRFVVAPFEEKELRALFGEQYQQYSEKVPRIIPFMKYCRIVKTCYSLVHRNTKKH
jgi:protein-S-isoprenylcysteine O-methyltransferase Ste14